ncbi:MAG: DUF1615 family protein [Snodgrassella sp.]|nr:DUF1615 family protein [Snodgrassella sp.]
MSYIRPTKINARFLLIAVSKVSLISVVLFILSACKDQKEWNDRSDNTFTTDQVMVIEPAKISRLIPARVKYRDEWAQDISRIMDELNIIKSKENVCSIIAVIDQESNFVANPVVPGLGAKAIKAFQTEVPEKFVRQFGPALGSAISRYFAYVLTNEPSRQNSFLIQMEKVKTEQQLDLIYRQIFVYVSKQFYADEIANAAAKLTGKDFGERNNPITTIGSMQVAVRYARDHQRDNASVNELRDYMYTREGGLYYGIHRLMKYPAAYDKALYRFADYNSGIYSSRNAAFQQNINRLLKLNMALDGDLLLYDKDGKASKQPSRTEIAINQLFADYDLSIKPERIRSDLLKEKQPEFEKTLTYNKVVWLYHQQFRKLAPYAIMPQVVISGPKLSKDYNTNWYANNVNRRYLLCMRAGSGSRRR